jgi:hypothetical protein
MFFYPFVGEVGGLSLAASFPCISKLFFLAEDIVRGDVGLDKTVVSWICMTYFPFDLLFLGSALFCGVCFSKSFLARFLFNSLLSL